MTGPPHWLNIVSKLFLKIISKLMCSKNAYVAQESRKWEADSQTVYPVDINQ
jgi:hypothetical protein